MTRSATPLCFQTAVLSGPLTNRFLLFSVLAILIATCPSAFAAPLTFTFNTDVASVLPTDGGANLPFSVSVGDPLETTLTFEPASGGPIYPQSGFLEFRLADQTLIIAGFDIHVRDNDFPNAVPISGSIADPANTPIVDQGPGSSDSHVLTCLSGLNCGNVPGHPELSYHPSIQLSGEDNVLNSDDLSANLALWNLFTFREMSISFVNSQTGGETYIGAYIGRVEQVPELGTMDMALASVITLAALLVFRALPFIRGPISTR